MIRLNTISLASREIQNDNTRTKSAENSSAIREAVCAVTKRSCRSAGLKENTLRKPKTTFIHTKNRSRIRYRDILGRKNFV